MFNLTPKQAVKEWLNCRLMGIKINCTGTAPACLLLNYTSKSKNSFTRLSTHQFTGIRMYVKELIKGQACCCSSIRPELQRSQDREHFAHGNYLPNSQFRLLSKFSIISMFLPRPLVELWGPERESTREQNPRVSQWETYSCSPHPLNSLSYSLIYYNVGKMGVVGKR